MKTALECRRRSRRARRREEEEEGEEGRRPTGAPEADEDDTGGHWRCTLLWRVGSARPGVAAAEEEDGPDSGGNRLRGSLVGLLLFILLRSDGIASGRTRDWG